MDELLITLDVMSIEELECVISKAQKLIQKKRQEAIRLAEIEKQRQEKERLEAERKKQEEIAELQRRLKELQGDTQGDGQSKVQNDVPQENTQQGIQRDTSLAAKSEESGTAPAKDQGYSMISCPQCHKLIPSDSRFCFYCGSDTTKKKEEKVDIHSFLSGLANSEQPLILCPDCRTPVPSGSQFCQNCGKPIGGVNQNVKPQQNVPQKTIVYMDDDIKKWDMLAGERDILGWKEINISQPEKKPFADIKITTKRILISVEGRMQRGLRNSGGLLVYAATSGMKKENHGL